MYDAIEDPDCYPGTRTLINKLGIRDPDRLEAFEEEITRERAAEPLPVGRLSVNHFRAVHKHLFQDVYHWAGRFRSVRISKGGSTFCYPENIADQLKVRFAWLKSQRFLRDLSREDFASKAANFLAELNAIHAFRDGNGRAQLAFLALLAAKAGHPLDFDQLVPETFLAAMIASFQGDESHLAKHLWQMTRPR